MNLKIQCPCGSRYSFEVEPIDGRMPFAVQCPTCGADGTEAANALIAEAAAAAPRLRVPAVPVAVAQVAPEAQPLPESPDTRRAVQNLLRQKKASEQRRYRLGLWILGLVIVAVVGYAGFWGWYYFSGSKPHLVYETAFGGEQADASVQFVGPDRFVLVDNQHAMLHDLKAGNDVWSATFPVTEGNRKPQIFTRGGFIWICLARQVVQLDSASGAIKTSIPIDGDLESCTPTDANILVVSAIDATTRRALRIDLASGDAASQDIVVPASETRLVANGLPSNVQPTAGVLEAQALDEQKFSKSLDAMSSRLFSTGENLVELRVKLVEPKVVWVQSIKPNPTTINGETTASTTTFGVQDGVFNDLKRSQTGGVKAIDQSRYEVKVRRWTGPTPVEWTGETVGPPAFFSLPTVDLMAGGKSLTVFDKQNQPLFQASLSYPLAERFISNNPASALVPAVEGPGVLYFSDEAVLTAFNLPGGQIRWRLTTIGVSKLQFDAQGALYVDSTTASPEDIQYSDQISFDKAKPLLLKVDPQNGKILWQKEGAGQDSFISGTYLYATSASVGGVPIAQALGESLGNMPPSDEPVHFHLYRINPATGQTLWDVFHQGAPQDLAFQQNKFVLNYDHDVQAWRFLSF